MPETWPSASHVSTYLNRFRDIVVEHCGLNKKERNKERRKEGKKERKKDRKKERKKGRKKTKNGTFATARFAFSCLPRGF